MAEQFVQQSGRPAHHDGMMCESTGLEPRADAVDEAQARPRCERLLARFDDGDRVAPSPLLAVDEGLRVRAARGS